MDTPMKMMSGPGCLGMKGDGFEHEGSIYLTYLTEVNSILLQRSNSARFMHSIANHRFNCCSIMISLSGAPTHSPQKS